MNKNVNDWLNDHGDYLYRFALARLRDPHQAEDAVQETLLAAIKSNSFEGDSSARTWLTGILKHKIIDLQRKQIREQPLSDLIDLDASDTSMDDFFDKSGHWLDKPQTLDMPENALEQKQFLSILSGCIDKLPAKLAAIFMMRDVHEVENENICKELDITATNAWVMLYRARMGLRKCLEINWITS
ncbi:MAG: sigma-70 family RNA polymerase sigma factor [Methylotenera sp.]|uniref:sigma-70 family RNA polymerase sigma factor n=1 Tax=Methylotenera sp. TaxID=2051956 RepID=UPI002488702A|nr:sigma-70 family RNA polymerase sigma factor [Methylotenera sp.]MDI1309765.1 sigma-70 family RNA polymerase sigma factor [Methylotenera sp.]